MVIDQIVIRRDRDEQDLLQLEDYEVFISKVTKEICRYTNDGSYTFVDVKYPDRDIAIIILQEASNDIHGNNV